MSFINYLASQAADQAFERILYVYKTENTSIRRKCDPWGNIRNILKNKYNEQSKLIGFNYFYSEFIRTASWKQLHLKKMS